MSKPASSILSRNGVVGYADNDDKHAPIGTLRLKPQPKSSDSYRIEVSHMYACTITPIPLTSDVNVKTIQESQYNAAVKISLSTVASVIGNVFISSFGDTISVGRVGGNHTDVIQMVALVTRGDLKKEYVKGVPFDMARTKESVRLFREWMSQALVEAAKAKDAMFEFVPTV